MIKINGYSGSTISLVRKETGSFQVIKYSNDLKRLSFQKEKQLKFSEFLKQDILLRTLFDTPSIMDSEQFTMDYYNGNSILDVIEFGKKSDIDKIVENIIR